MSVARVIVLGGAGMLGHKMFQALREHFSGAFCTVREDIRKPPFESVELLQGDDVLPGVDVTDFPALEAVLSALHPEFVVNCVGVIKQRAEALSPIPSITINSLLPHKLAEMATRWGGRVIHFSTDCVFNGKRGATSKTIPRTPKTSTERRSFSARWRPPTPSPCGLPSLAGNSANTVRCSIGSSAKTKTRFAGTGGSSIPG